MSITYMYLQPSETTAIRHPSPHTFREVVDTELKVEVDIGVVVQSIKSFLDKPKHSQDVDVYF